MSDIFRYESDDDDDDDDNDVRGLAGCSGAGDGGLFIYLQRTLCIFFVLSFSYMFKNVIFPSATFNR